MYVRSTRTCVVMYLHTCMHSRKQVFNRMYRVCYIWIMFLPEEACLADGPLKVGISITT